MPEPVFHPEDLSRIRERGMDPEALARQLELFRFPTGHLQIARPATVGDGIRRIADPDLSALRSEYESGKALGRFSKFVPASGAATRMFSGLDALRLRADWGSLEDLRALAHRGDPDAVQGVVFFENLSRFAFYPALVDRLPGNMAEIPSDIPPRRILESLLDPAGLDLIRCSKGLVPFHHGEGKPRTALEEHLIEAIELTQDSGGGVRAHFTVLVEHLGKFKAAAEQCIPNLGGMKVGNLHLSFSVQDRSLDTLAAEPDFRPARDRQGVLLFRPGGHGALLRNLQETNGDLVFLKNIDNVASGTLRDVGWDARKILGGLAIKLRGTADLYLEDLEGGLPPPERLAEIIRFLENGFGRKIISSGRDTLRLELQAALDRPMRVCGMVPNAGEPGGGPCWVRRGPDREDLQIVESAQVDPGSPDQLHRLQAGTHFNPVDMVACLRDRTGKPYDLSRYVENEWTLLSRKMLEGREILILEKPGLWNGAMADWLTVFVEIPLESFHPVKTVMDLLRPGHQSKE